MSIILAEQSTLSATPRHSRAKLNFWSTLGQTLDTDSAFVGLLTFYFILFIDSIELYDTNLDTYVYEIYLDSSQFLLSKLARSTCVV